jgi:carbon storage regulator
MLVLSRKVGEAIQIGDDVTVTVVRIRDAVVRIGIEAPPQVPVNRTELVLRAVDEKKPPD